jgi:hypothetical protein
MGWSWDGSTPYQDIVDGAFLAWSGSDLRDHTTAATSLEKVEGHFGTIGDGDLIVESTNAPIDGGFSSECCPSNCAVLVRKLSALGGRKNRGRLFYPDVPKTHVNQNGIMDSSWTSQLQSDFEDFFTAVSDVTGLEDGVLFHSDELDAPTELIGLKVQRQIATQRRRMRP